jgi:hypothetical protein
VGIGVGLISRDVQAQSKIPFLLWKGFVEKPIDSRAEGVRGMAAIKILDSLIFVKGCPFKDTTDRGGVSGTAIMVPA